MTSEISKSMVSYNLSKIEKRVEKDLCQDKEEAIAALFAKMKLTGSSQANLRDEIYKFDSGHHTFQVENHLVYLARQSLEDKISTGFFSIEKKSFFAFGGGGKIYAIKESNEPLVLKLSRKLLKTHDEDGHKIPLPLLENSRTEFGEIVARNIFNELQVIGQITKHCQNYRGLNVEIFAKVSFNNQVGYLNRAFPCDLLSFIDQNAISSGDRYDIMRQLIRALDNLHSIGLRHRDLKLSNILIRPRACSGYDVVISDFGNTCTINRFFAKGLPHPDIQTIMNGTSEKYASRNNICLMMKTLETMSNYPRDSKEYLEGIRRIDQLLVDNDQFALGLCYYILWTSKAPDFACFHTNAYFAFDRGLTLEEENKKLHQMRQELLTASHQISMSIYGNPSHIAKQILCSIGKGLGIHIT